MFPDLARLSVHEESRDAAAPNGFTLLETLIALTVAAILAIGIVRFFATTSAMSSTADRRFEVATLMLQLVDGLPRPGDLAAFTDSGDRGKLHWRMTSVPLDRNDTARLFESAPGGALERPWQPYRISIEVRDATNLLDRAETIRLGRQSADTSGMAAP